MKKSIFFLLIFLCLSSITTAVPITWTGNGGDKYWNNAANWDTGTVPAVNDDVTILANSGKVVFNMSFRRVQSLLIYSGSKLVIQANAHLKVEGSSGFGLNNLGGIVVNKGTLTAGDAASSAIRNDGNFNNRGLLRISNTTNFGLETSDTLLNEVGASIEILHSDQFGIVAGGEFTNEGSIRFLDGGSGLGLSCQGNLVNTVDGSIVFEGTNPGYISTNNSVAGNIQNYGVVDVGTSMTNTFGVYLGMGGLWMNHPTAELYIRGATGTALGIVLTGVFENAGLLEIDGGTSNCEGVELTGDGAFINQAGATTIISSVAVGFLIISNNSSRVDNYGSLQCLNITTGVASLGIITNHAGADMLIQATWSGLENYLGGNLENAGTLTVESTVDNEGTFTNENCSMLDIQGSIDNTGTFLNYGWMTSSTNALVHPNNGLQIINYGIVNDPYDRYTSILSNQRIRIEPLGNMQANIAYPNALDLATAGSFTNSIWYLEENLSTSAGVYDMAINTFYPNVNAVGATYLYAEFTDGTYGCSEVVAMRVDGTISPISSGSSLAMAAQRRSQVESIPDQKLTVYPNPSSGIVHLQLPEAPEGDFEIRLGDLHGRMVWQEQVSDVSQWTVDLEGQIAPGIYIIQVFQNEKLLSQEKVVIQ